MNKKLIAALMMSMFLIGCSGSEETTNTDTIDVVKSNEIVEKVESSITESEVGPRQMVSLAELRQNEFVLQSVRTTCVFSAMAKNIQAMNENSW